METRTQQTVPEEMILGTVCRRKVINKKKDRKSGLRRWRRRSIVWEIRKMFIERRGKETRSRKG